MEGPIMVLAALIAVGVFWFVIGYALWLAYSKKGQRKLKRESMKRQIKQGMREAEIEDGLSEEVLAEVMEEQRRKQARRGQ